MGADEAEAADGMTAHVLAEIDGRRMCATCHVRWPCLGKQLHVKNRLEELRSKYGREIEQEQPPIPVVVQSAPARIEHVVLPNPPAAAAPKADFGDLDV